MRPFRVWRSALILTLATGVLAGQPARAQAQMSATSGEITATLYIPEGVTKMRGILAFTPLGLGSGWFGDADFRALAKRLELGMVRLSGERSNGDDPSYPMRCTNGRFKMFVDALAELAKVSGHPELANAPIIGGGHSHGGDWWNYFNACYPERMVAVFCKSSGGVQYSRGALRTPMIWEIGTEDLIANGNKQYRGIMFAHRNKGQQLTLVLGPGEGHNNITPGARQLVADVMESYFRLRVPADADPAKGPVQLLDVDEAQGQHWLGDNHTREIAPFAMSALKGALHKTSFLASAEIAMKWKAGGANLPTTITVDADGTCSRCYPQVASEAAQKPLNIGPGEPPPDAGTAGNGGSGGNVGGSGGGADAGAGGAPAGSAGSGGSATAGSGGAASGGISGSGSGGSSGAAAGGSTAVPQPSTSTAGGCVVGAQGSPGTLSWLAIALAALVAGRRRRSR